MIQLNLIDLDSVRRFTDQFTSKYAHLDILVNNAGVVSLRDRQVTRDGIEMHMATNHLGHFALTGSLLPVIKRSNSRIVTMSSGGYLFATLDFEDMNWESRKYDRVKCYGASKLANLLFMVELDRQFEQHDYSSISVGAHPGLSATQGQKNRAEGLFYKTMAQSVEMGALPALMGATAEDVEGKMYFGPKWFIRGYPVSSKLKDVVWDKEMAKKLWRYSEEKTGVLYRF